ncbi:MAG: ABC transporter substrate-binding protein [Actinomycetales bacterium]|nr:ABC transporter substrate-binding protein [Actinomycetales bacterium]
MIARNRRKRSWIAAAVLVAGSLVATSLPAHAETGVTASEIKLGITLPLTGSASPGYNKVGDAMKAYFNYVNDNGGVYGRKINLVIKNDEYLPSLAIAKTNELILKDKVFALVGALGTANHEAVANSVGLARRGIPDLFISTGFSGFADKKKFPTTFPIFPSYVMEAKIMGQYLKETYAGKKLGIIYQDDDFGSDALKGFAQAGVKFDVSVPYASGSQSQTTAPTWISKLAAGGAEVVVVFGVTSAAGLALAVAAGAKYAPKWILGSVSGDATTLKALGVPAAVLTGAQGASYLPSPADTTDEYVKLFQEVNTKYNNNVAFDNNVLVGMNTAMVTVQALRAAGSNLTRKGLISAIQKKGSTFASAALVPLNYSATSQVGYNGYWFGQYDSTGVMKPLATGVVVYTTDSGSGAVVKSTFKRPAMPAKGLPTNS